jgi:nucleoside-diphosphate-sugar epimerase
LEHTVAAKVILITGATGLLGSHTAEQLVAAGETVRALVRPGSDTTFLQGLGVQLIEGDLRRPESLPAALAGADVVYHCAARVGEWGPWRQFQEQIIDSTANLFAACQSVGVGRVLHVSSIIVYGHPRLRDGLFTEDEPLGQNLWVWDNYCRAKMRAEEICREYKGDWTVVRPSWIYGPRDRTTLPRVLKALRAGRVAIIGDGENLLNIIHAADVAAGAILAANHPGAGGRAYNLSSKGEMTQRAFLNHLTAALGLPPIKRHCPYGVSFWGGFAAECVGRAIRLRRPPHFTRYAVALIGRPTRFSIERARTELGWSPRVNVIDGVRETLDWYYQTTGEPRAPAATQAAGVGR